VTVCKLNNNCGIYSSPDILTNLVSIALNFTNAHKLFFYKHFVLKEEMHRPTTRLTCASRGSSVSLVSDYGLDDRGSIPDRGR
jgi:hypothetical protein